VTEFSYRYSSPEIARVFVSFQVNSASRQKEVQGIVQALGKENMTATDISDDEMSKSHTRYMIGGCSTVPNERVFRFGEILRR
jgi:threonine dehydratase